MDENMEQQNVDEAAEVEAHVANILDLQALKVLSEASDGSCFSIVSYVNETKTTA
ncbi:hypothetical protein ACFU6K_30550 [Kitasatospora sp. NPDC057512]|uniref:hypothetical protein n=1 Tax=Kitasatospora sp. NPDC057512 TaxID=3346154 RepID=UPI0036A7C541